MFAWLCMVAGSFLSACTNTAATASEAEAAFEAPPAVVKTIALEPLSLARRREGIANILSPADLVDLDAEIRNTKIAMEFSTLQFERFKTTPTLPKLTVENSERQLKTDTSQMDRLKARLTHTWGEDAPMIDDTRRQEIVQALTAGTKALTRLDFAGGLDGEPQNVEVKPLGSKAPVKVEALWQAPSGNQAMPGVSYYALIAQAAGLRPGDRAITSAETGTLKGLVIPNSSIVVTDSTSWCYVETSPGEYVRKPVTLETPVAAGYLVNDGFEAGMKIVVAGASTLLAREAAATSDGDDDDDGPKRPAAKPKTQSAPAAPDTAETPAASNDDDDAAKSETPKPAHATADAEREPGSAPIDRN